MASKFIVGEAVSTSFHVKGEIFTYEGTVVDADDGHVFIRTDLIGDVHKFFPRSVCMNYNIWTNQGRVYLSRSPRYVKKIIYDDGLDNWV